MDKALRNSLRSAVADCRGVLEEEVRRQLEGTFGVTPRGEFLVREEFVPYGYENHLAAREEILASIRHIESHGIARQQAVEQFTRETAFTILNRLAALKLMEHETRGLIPESVGRGKESKGFLLFQKVSPEVCRAARNGDLLDGGYRLYLECLFDDLATELGVLFDRRLPQSIIFPSDACMKRVLDILNGPSISCVWGEDETIGWIYQYFTPKEMRDRARKASQAPRNAYELAFRNQFYTPRYVVQFLVDNTLGRTWYEMSRGETRLTEICSYLVRRPNEIFLDQGEPAPAPRSREHEPSPEELLRQPVHISYRVKKDPRELRILDPACGSGHFLLYSYDLLAAIYEEAWEDPEASAFNESGQTLRHDFPDREELRAAVPGLILRHNLYGIDIDLRATQIAALALWLRVQRSFQELGLKVAARPRITRSNIVCAEPMPGEQALLDEFVAELPPDALGPLVPIVFETMSLAGEAGSLLKIEAEIREAVKKRTGELGALFRDLDAENWTETEREVLLALRRYAEKAANGKAFIRRLFAEDATQGFAFIDLCRQRFDVVLMNPPFGEASKPSKSYIEKRYPRTKNDVYAAFVERGLELLQTRGMLGAITSRTGFFLSSFQKWREEILLKEAQPTVVADLGQGVLDSAMVETAAYCLTKRACPA